MTQETAKPESVAATIANTMKEGKVTQLGPSRLLLAEHAHQTFVACPETGTPPDAVLDSKYWAHYSVNPNLQMRAGDIIYVKPEDGTYFQELIVRSTYRGGVNVKELRRVKLDSTPDAVKDMGDHEVKFSGDRLKWCVYRKSDKRRLSDGHQDPGQAVAWLAEHMKAIAA